MSEGFSKHLREMMYGVIADDFGVTPDEVRTRLGAVFAPEETVRREDAQLSVAEVAGRVGRDPQYVRRQIKGGALPARKHGRRYSIAEADFDAWNDATIVRPRQSHDRASEADLRPRANSADQGLKSLLSEERRR